MAHYVGLDVSVRHTSICIVDDVGKVVREARVTSEPESIIPILTAQHLACRRVGLEAGPLSQWLFNTLGVGWSSGDLRRDPTHEGCTGGADQQD